MWQGITFIDGHSVADTITRVQDDTGGTTGSVQRQYGLNGHVHGWCVERLKHDLQSPRMNFIIVVNMTLASLSFSLVTA